MPHEGDGTGMNGRGGAGGRHDAGGWAKEQAVQRHHNHVFRPGGGIAAPVLAQTLGQTLGLALALTLALTLVLTLAWPGWVAARNIAAHGENGQAGVARTNPVQPAGTGRLATTGLVFVTQQFPPFNYLERTDDGERVAGPVAEIITLACQRMGVGCTFRLLPWARAQQEVRSGAADGIFVIGRAPEREDWLHFCPPLVRGEYGFFVRMENPLRYIAPRDVAGYRVGVYGPSLTSDILNQLARQARMTVDVAADNDAGFLKLAQGRIDAVFSNKENGLATIALLRIANLRYAGWHSRVDYTIAFSRHAAPEAVAAFEAALHALHREGGLERCLSPYGLHSVFPGQKGSVPGAPDTPGAPGAPRGEAPAMPAAMLDVAPNLAAPTGLD